MKRVTLHNKKKINIQRDYSKGVHIRFKSDFPQEISHCIDENTWTRFIGELNHLYEDAEKVTGRTICETILGLCTCYAAKLCYTPVGYQMMDRIDDFICDSNDKSMVPNGLYIANPIERGFRVLEITLIYEKPEVKQQPSDIYQNIPRNSPLVPR